MEEIVPTNEKNNDPLVVSYLTIRRAVGILGATLPVVLVIFSLLIGNCQEVQGSVSHYYYTNMRNYFVGCLCAVALFLFSYKGYDEKENILGNLACLFALCVAFFPTSVDAGNLTACVTEVTDNGIFSKIHFICAALFFLVLAYFSIALFTKSGGIPTPQKLKRNKLYKICGYIILLCIILIALYSNVPWLQSKLKDYKPVFWLETLALWSFGLSWLTKGETLLKDK